MIIKQIRVKNFRSVLDVTLDIDCLTALVGANGSGKSTFLRSLELFYSPSPKIDLEDYYNGEIENEIVIAITYHELSENAKELFNNYIQNNELTVERVITWDAGKTTAKYYGASLQNPDFQAIRSAPSANEKKFLYDALFQQEEYSNFPKWKNQSEILEKLKNWETENPEKSIRQRDDGQFFGFTGVGQGYLGKFTRFLFIPAVRDASSDSLDNRGSVLTDLMDLVVRNVLASKDAVKKLKEETQKQYEDIMNPTNLSELITLADKLTTTLKTFVPDASVDLNWLPLEQVNIPMPKANVKLIEDGYRSTVGRTGHGLQRAFILTMLQHLVVAKSSMDVGQEDRLPNLILAIEEPEVYQHPSRQRHFANILTKLAKGRTPGVAERTQIIFATHSPLFVNINIFNKIRLLRKFPGTDGKPKVTKIICTNLDKVACKLWEADGKPGTTYTGNSLLPRLKTIMTPWMSEGFFADVIVLVEGEDDRAAILGIAKAEGVELESNGFCIIPCGGKTNIDRPTLIFRELGIPVYIIWDGDKGDKDAKANDNHRLLRLMGHPVVDWPCQVEKYFACFEVNLETTLRNEIGVHEFDELLTKYREMFCIPKKKHALKNPSVIACIVNDTIKIGRNSETLKKIFNSILELKIIS